jgi:hypothetical protein
VTTSTDHPELLGSDDDDDGGCFVPYVIEGSGGRERQYDMWSRLLADRIVMARARSGRRW